MSWAASGDGCGGEMVERGVRYSMKGVDTFSGRTRWLGRNLRASGLGVFSVWMKIVRRCCCCGARAHGLLAWAASWGRARALDARLPPVCACLFVVVVAVVEAVRGS